MALREAVRIGVGDDEIHGDLAVPKTASGIVVFAHGSGSSRHSPRNRLVAEHLNDAGFGTLLIDLLTEAEEQVDLQTRELRFDIELLAQRLSGVNRWTRDRHDLPVGYFGASTGAAAALVAAAREPEGIGAVVSRGGRPDLAAEHLPVVRAPTLLIVGGADTPVIGMNESAFRELRCPKALEIVPGASHLFEEPGALERVSELAAGWFGRHLG